MSQNDDNDLQYLVADHPLLSKMQETLTRQLEIELEKLRIEETTDLKILSKFEQQKEDIGLQVYEKQQKIVELQRLTEEKENHLHQVKSERIKF